MAHTAWGPTEIARFMRWQLSLQKSKLGEPAELPDEVLEFEKENGKKKKKDRGSKRKASSSSEESADDEDEGDEGDESEEIVDYELQAR
eukprot:s756_g11.t1